MNLPGSAKTHLWTGLLLALGGVLVGGYAYTGDRIYELTFLPVALFGLILVLGGSALAGYGQANRPRMGGRPSQDEDEGPTFRERVQERFAALLPGDEDTDRQVGSEADDSSTPPSSDAETSQTAEDEDEGPSVIERVTTGASSLLAAVKPDTEADEGNHRAEDPEPSGPATEPDEPDPVEADLECPKCRTSFTASGQSPFEAECPNCGYADLVDPS